MNTVVKPAISALLLILFSNFCVKAQEVQSITQGLSVQVCGNLDNWRSNSLLLGDIADVESNGRGLGAELSYGFTANLEAFVGYNFSNFNLSNDWNVFRLEHYTLGVQYNFGASRQKVRPYLNGAIGSNNLKIADIFIQEDNIVVFDDAEMILKGLSGNLGGGVLYFPIPQLAIEAGLVGRFGRFSNVLVNSSAYDAKQTLDFRFITFKIGVSYYFF
jgi:opacity protein-like surface antigen